MEREGIDGTITVTASGVDIVYAKAAARRKRSTSISFPFNRIEAVDYQAATGGRWALDRLLILAAGYSGSDSPNSTATFTFGRGSDGEEVANRIAESAGSVRPASAVLEARAADVQDAPPKGFRARLTAFNDTMNRLAAEQATSGKFAGVYLGDGMIGWTEQGRARREPVTGARAEVAVGADAQRRITATRIVLIGVFALAFRKQKGTGFLTIENDTYYLGVPFPIKDERDARAFAAKVNAAARNGLTSAE